MQESRFLIEGMTCGHCERAVSEALTAVKDVVAASVSADDGVAVVSHGDGFDPAAAGAAITAAGYSLRV
ncbi:heavy-metal-associated domain-containing protein [Microbacterium sp. RU33B]|uniref:heavy-metal-associated domain-containing protein n=1 Tax=Microbacterium sp. RU33B TaxID=1907390 RepID=UPI000960FDCF|nr:heavy-metal-associated domain-containing protein [Microbacterium sp. RU33B]SIT72299.1 Copper chaperone CopZ [Microbacterium sp. RU33B]